MYDSNNDTGTLFYPTNCNPLFTQTISCDGKQSVARRCSNLPENRFHRVKFKELRLIFGVCSACRKTIREVFSYGCQTRYLYNQYKYIVRRSSAGFYLFKRINEFADKITCLCITLRTSESNII